MRQTPVPACIVIRVVPFLNARGVPVSVLREKNACKPEIIHICDFRRDVFGADFGAVSALIVEISAPKAYK